VSGTEGEVTPDARPPDVTSHRQGWVARLQWFFQEDPRTGVSLEDALPLVAVTEVDNCWNCYPITVSSYCSERYWAEFKVRCRYLTAACPVKAEPD